MSPELTNLIFSVVTPALRAGASVTIATLIVIGAVLAMAVAGMLLTVGSGAAADWKAWRALRAQPSPCSPVPARPTPDAFLYVPFTHKDQLWALRQCSPCQSPEWRAATYVRPVGAPIHPILQENIGHVSMELSSGEAHLAIAAARVIETRDAIISSG